LPLQDHGGDGVCLKIALCYACSQVLAWEAEERGANANVAEIRRQLEIARTLMSKMAHARKQADGVKTGAMDLAQLVREIESSVDTVLDSISGCL
jgi:hypothetical protein